MISAQQNADCLAKLGMLKFFPVKEAVVVEIGRLLNDLCDNDHEARSLTAAVLESFTEWPGPGKVRELHRSEIAARRPQEAQPEGCDLCRGMAGWRPVFIVIDHSQRPPRKQVFRPDRNPWQVRDQLWEQHAKNGSISLYEEIAPCSCAAGRVRQEQVRKLDARERGQ